MNYAMLPNYSTRRTSFLGSLATEIGVCHLPLWSCWKVSNKIFVDENVFKRYLEKHIRGDCYAVVFGIYTSALIICHDNIWWLVEQLIWTGKSTALILTSYFYVFQLKHHWRRRCYKQCNISHCCTISSSLLWFPTRDMVVRSYFGNDGENNSNLVDYANWNF